MQAQLEKEAGVRRRIEETKQRLERGLNFIKSLIGIGETAVHLVEEDGVLRRHIDPFCGAILGVTQSVGGIALIGSLAYEVYVVRSSFAVSLTMIDAFRGPCRTLF